MNDGEPPPFTVDNETGTSPFLIVADHAGKYLPRRLGQLGLSNAECRRHIAWDIGIGAVCSLIGTALDAVVIRQNYSRLVIDCNRTPGSETSIVGLSELTRVPGNIGLSESHKVDRVREIFQPYHDRITTELDQRRETGRPTALISMHSFAPVFKTVTRLWHVGVLYNRDPRFAMELLHREEGLVIGDNEPYDVTDASDYTIPVHGEQRKLHHVAIEIPRPHHGRSESADVGGFGCTIASESLSAVHSPPGPQMKLGDSVSSKGGIRSAHFGDVPLLAVAGNVPTPRNLAP